MVVILINEQTKQLCFETEIDAISEMTHNGYQIVKYIR